MSEKKKVKTKGTMQRDKVVSQLEDLVESLKNGSLSVTVGEETLTLSPQEIVEFEMEVSAKKDKEKLSIEINWKKPPFSAIDANVKIG